MSEIDCNCPECQHKREPSKNERRLLYNTLLVKAKDWGRVKFNWDKSYFNICRKKLFQLSQTFNQQHYQWIIYDRVGLLVAKSENLTTAEMPTGPKKVEVPV